MTQKHYVTWDEVEGFIKDVIKRYEYAGITGVYGIPRGGIILATLISYKMKIPMLMAPTKGCIIVDDISDTGETLIHYVRNTSGGGENKGYHIVTMYYRNGSMVVPEYYKYTKEGKWIVFPWEE